MDDMITVSLSAAPTPAEQYSPNFEDPSVGNTPVRHLLDPQSFISPIQSCSEVVGQCLDLYEVHDTDDANYEQEHEKETKKIIGHLHRLGAVNTAEIERRKKRIADTEAVVASQGTEIDALRSRVTELNSEVEMERDLQREMRSHCTEVSGNLEENIKEIDVLKKQLDEARLQKAETEQNYDNKRRMISDELRKAHTDRSKLENELRDRNLIRQREEAEIILLRKEMNDLWRLLNQSDEKLSRAYHDQATLAFAICRNANGDYTSESFREMLLRCQLSVDIVDDLLSRSDNFGPLVNIAPDESLAKCDSSAGKKRLHESGNNDEPQRKSTRPTRQTRSTEFNRQQTAKRVNSSDHTRGS